MRLLSFFVIFVLSLATASAETFNLSKKAVFSDCPTCPQMVIIPPGSFQMGFDGGVNEERYEGPVHTVKIPYSFAFGRFEITNAQFREFFSETGYQAGSDCRMWTGKTVEAVAGSNWEDPRYGRPPKENEPVACISWYDAKAYVQWLAEKTGQPYRLPTESEWEYVAHANTSTVYPWGDSPDEGCGVANYYDQSADGLRPWDAVDCNDGNRIVAPVGSLLPNAFGVYDVVGNVWEWVEDCHVVPYGVQPTDGRAHQVEGKCEKRGVRGGAWHSRATWQRPTFRGRDTEDFVTQVFGIRVVRNLD